MKYLKKSLNFEHFKQLLHLDYVLHFGTGISTIKMAAKFENFFPLLEEIKPDDQGTYTCEIDVMGKPLSIQHTVSRFLRQIPPR